MKRARTESRVFPVKRAINKEIIAISRTQSTSQGATTLTTATYPCTITGVRWHIGLKNTYAGANNFWWAIVLVKDGQTADTLATSDGASIYSPEGNVLAWGMVELDDAAGDLTFNGEGSTKTMRKLQGGDTIQFISISAAASMTLRAGVQFFCKA